MDQPEIERKAISKISRRLIPFMFILYVIWLGSVAESNCNMPGCIRYFRIEGIAKGFYFAVGYPIIFLFECDISLRL
jgi:hypothetical protein